MTDRYVLLKDGHIGLVSWHGLATGVLYKSASDIARYAGWARGRALSHPHPEYWKEAYERTEQACLAEMVTRKLLADEHPENELPDPYWDVRF